MQDKSLPQLDDLYKEIILEHYRKPHGRIPLERIDYHAEGMNPLCGDEVKLGLQLKSGKIERVHLEAHGCSISVASSSMLVQMLEGKTLEEAKKISSYLKDVMHNKINSHVIARSGSDPHASLGAGSAIRHEVSSRVFDEGSPSGLLEDPSLRSGQSSGLDCFVRAKALPRNDEKTLDIGDLEALEGVKNFPVRIKCALLPWTTLEEALVGHEHVEVS